VTEEDARLELLKTELNAIDNAIRNMDTIVFQIKGWCVTAALAIGGFAISTHTPALTLIGMVAVAGFYLINSQFKVIQRQYITRNRALDAELKDVGIMQVLSGKGSLQIVGTAILEFPKDTSYWKTFRSALSKVLHEARLPSTFTLYAFLLLCLIVEAIVEFA
jgi:hypothetical protein